MVVDRDLQKLNKSEYILFSKDNSGLIEKSFQIKCSIGVHEIQFPDIFSKISETFVIADYVSKNSSSNHFDRSFRAIYQFNYFEKKLNVIPQDWFNNGNIDFGYQWITQIARLDNEKLCASEIFER